MADKFPHQEFRDFAIEMIEWGGAVRFKREIISSGPEWNPTQTNLDTPIYGVVLNYELNEIDGTLIKRTDKKMMTYTELKTNDKIVDSDGIAYSIISVKVEKPADIAMYYEVQLRT